MTGIPSYTQIIEYYTAKAEKGDVSAMKALGDLYYQGASGKIM